MKCCCAEKSFAEEGWDLCWFQLLLSCKRKSRMQTISRVPDTEMRAKRQRVERSPIGGVYYCWGETGTTGSEDSRRSKESCGYCNCWEEGDQCRLLRNACYPSISTAGWTKVKLFIAKIMDSLQEGARVEIYCSSDKDGVENTMNSGSSFRSCYQFLRRLYWFLLLFSRCTQINDDDNVVLMMPIFIFL